MNFQKQDSLAQTTQRDLLPISRVFTVSSIAGIRGTFGVPSGVSLGRSTSKLELEEPCSSSDSTSLLGFLATKTTVLLVNYYKQQFT